MKVRFDVCIIIIICIAVVINNLYWLIGLVVFNQKISTFILLLRSQGNLRDESMKNLRLFSNFNQKTALARQTEKSWKHRQMLINLVSSVSYSICCSLHLYFIWIFRWFHEVVERQPNIFSIFRCEALLEKNLRLFFKGSHSFREVYELRKSTQTFTFWVKLKLLQISREKNETKQN